MERLDNGMIRVYTDHTGRWYNDYTEEEYNKLIEDCNNDPLMKILQEEISIEINREILKEYFSK